MSEEDLQRIERALSGDRAVAEQLAEDLMEVIEREAVAGLIRWRRSTRDVKDLVHEIIIHLFEDDGRVLRRWSPGRGASLRGFVAVVASRRISNILQSGRQSGHREDPHDPGDFDYRSSTAQTSPEAIAASRESLERVVDALEEGLSDQGRAVFRALFIEQRSVAWIVEQFEMTPEAVYTWRSRIVRRAREIAEQIGLETSASTGRSRS